MAKNTTDYLSYGLSIMIIGLLLLLDKTGVLLRIHAQYLLTIGSLFLIVGIIFLCFQYDKKIGLILTIMGAIISSNLIFDWMHSFSVLIVPIFLLIVGLGMILISKR